MKISAYRNSEETATSDKPDLDLIHAGLYLQWMALECDISSHSHEHWKKKVKRRLKSERRQV
jgi:hypothetical protein